MAVKHTPFPMMHLSVSYHLHNHKDQEQCSNSLNLIHLLNIVIFTSVKCEIPTFTKLPVKIKRVICVMTSDPV